MTATTASASARLRHIALVAAVGVLAAVLPAAGAPAGAPGDAPQGLNPPPPGAVEVVPGDVDLQYFWMTDDSLWALSTEGTVIRRSLDATDSAVTLGRAEEVVRVEQTAVAAADGTIGYLRPVDPRLVFRAPAGAEEVPAWGTGDAYRWGVGALTADWFVTGDWGNSVVSRATGAQLDLMAVSSAPADSTAASLGRVALAEDRVVWAAGGPRAPGAPGSARRSPGAVRREEGHRAGDEQADLHADVGQRALRAAQDAVRGIALGAVEPTRDGQLDRGVVAVERDGVDGRDDAAAGADHVELLGPYRDLSAPAGHVVPAQQLERPDGRARDTALDVGGEQHGVADEARGLQVHGFAVDARGLGGLHDDAVAHYGDEVGDAQGLFLVVRDEDARRAGGLEGGADVLAERAAQGRVECGEGLVEEDDVGLGGQRPRDGDALLLAAGQLRGHPVAGVREADEREEVLDAFAAAAARGRAATGHAERDVLRDGQVREERALLRDDAHAAALGRHPGAPGDDDAPTDADFAGVGGLEPGDDAQKRGLAAAGVAEERGERARRDVQVHAAQDGRRPEGLVHATDLEAAHAATSVRAAGCAAGPRACTRVRTTVGTAASTTSATA